MSAISPRLGYRIVGAGPGLLVKSGPSGLFAILVIAASGSNLSVYDGLDAGGVLVYAKDAVVRGEILSFGGIGMAIKNGLYVVITNAGSVNVLYT